MHLFINKMELVKNVCSCPDRLGLKIMCGLGMRLSRISRKHRLFCAILQDIFLIENHKKP